MSEQKQLTKEFESYETLQTGSWLCVNHGLGDTQLKFAVVDSINSENETITIVSNLWKRRETKVEFHWAESFLRSGQWRLCTPPLVMQNVQGDLLDHQLPF
jgi:hypothetical protein